MNKNNSLKIEQKIAELEKIITWFDSEDFELESALDRYAVAQKLAQEIQHELESLKNSITRVDAKET